VIAMDDDNKYQFYEDYDPVPNASKSLNDPEDDYTRRASYRDLLGILESEEAWSKEDALKAAEVKEKLDKWNENRTNRGAVTPKTVRTVRDRLNELYYEQYQLVYRIQPSKANKYYKPRDEDIKSPIVRKSIHHGSNVADKIEKLLYGHDLIVISVFGYLIGSIVVHFHQYGRSVIGASILLFLIGHIMAYYDKPLFEV
jgi:hypothetical protein